MFCYLQIEFQKCFRDCLSKEISIVDSVWDYHVENRNAFFKLLKKIQINFQTETRTHA